MLLQIGVCLREMSATVEAPIDREGRGMGCLQDQMTAAVDELPLTLRITAPEHEYEVLALAIERIDSRIGQLFPPLVGMAGGVMCLDGKRSVQEQRHLALPNR